MRNLKTSLVATFLLLLFTSNLCAQSVGINATGAAPDASALLDLSSTDKGFLITRVDTININSPAFGLMTLSPADSCLYLFNGVIWKGMGGGGSDCACNCNNIPEISTCEPDKVTKIVDVTNPKTGKTWMDRNLGASQVATSSTDAAAYGDLYQWGRCSDGHEKRSSSTNPTLSSTDNPGHGDFILNSTPPYDWRSPQNDNLWQGASGINNPCPAGYRLPTEAELEDERLSWISNNAAGAFNSPLKFSLGGYRVNNTGGFSRVNEMGYYRSSSLNPAGTLTLTISNTNAFVSAGGRGVGFSVRCIKD